MDLTSCRDEGSGLCDGGHVREMREEKGKVVKDGKGRACDDGAGVKGEEEDEQKEEEEEVKEGRTAAVRHVATPPVSWV